MTKFKAQMTQNVCSLLREWEIPNKSGNPLTRVKNPQSKEDRKPRNETHLVLVAAHHCCRLARRWPPLSSSLADRCAYLLSYSSFGFFNLSHNASSLLFLVPFIMPLSGDNAKKGSVRTHSAWNHCVSIDEKSRKVKIVRRS